MHTYIHIHPHAYMHIYIYKHRHTHIYIHIHIHTHTNYQNYQIIQSSQWKKVIVPDKFVLNNKIHVCNL